jgi:hypothetical protein
MSLRPASFSVESPFHQPETFLDAKIHRQARHDRGVGFFEDLSRFVHEAHEFREARRVFFGDAFDGLGVEGEVGTIRLQNT